jgi:glycyl-tRNA synthetase
MRFAYGGLHFRITTSYHSFHRRFQSTMPTTVNNITMPTTVNKITHPFDKSRLDALLNRRFFYAPAFEIYGGISLFSSIVDL